MICFQGSNILFYFIQKTICTNILHHSKPKSSTNRKETPTAATKTT